jgi:hypothetical protein
MRHTTADAAQKLGQDWTHMSLEDKSAWTFVAGEWNQGADGTITAPGGLEDENLAFHTGKAYRDFEAEFDFRADVVWTDPGFAFWASDPSHYYVVHFPYVGQQYRAEHFWACISKVGESGYVQVLSMEMVHGVSSAPKLWHKARVEVDGDTIRLWVDGRPIRPVVDSSYSGAGFVGLVTSSSVGGGEKSSFRNVKVCGKDEKSTWNSSVHPVKPYFHVTTKSGTGCGNICRAPNGDLLVSIESRLLRSTDNGRTWSDTETLSDVAPSARMLYLTQDKTLGQLVINHVKPPFEIERLVSTDSGRTWGEPADAGIIALPEERMITGFYPSCLLRLRDGALLMFAYGDPGDESPKVGGRLYPKPNALGLMGVCMRSEDDGRSWSDPIDIDGHHDEPFLIAKEFSETSAAQTDEGNVIALTRPFRSPVMWETWSEDGGKTWTPQARGPFPMYACNNSMICTASGYLLIAGRFPGIAAQVSRDGGMTWQGFKIDNAIWANGATFEVEPDVVLYIYGGRSNPSEMRGQIIKITPDGLLPIR